MRSSPKENLFSRGKFMGPRFRIPPELTAGVHLELALELPSELRYVGPAAGYFSRLAREHGFSEEVWAESLPLALDEAITNAMRHGNGLKAGRRVALRARLDGEALEIRVRDEGRGFDPDSLPDPREGDSLFRPGGRGVFLIRTLCDELRYEDGGREAVLRFRRDGAG